jgi:hypothetical protein
MRQLFLSFVLSLASDMTEKGDAESFRARSGLHQRRRYFEMV